MEAVKKALNQLILELIYLVDLLTFVGIHKQMPTIIPTHIYCDNKNAVDLCNIIKHSHKTKVINMRIHFIRDMMKKEFVLIKSVRIFLQNL